MDRGPHLELGAICLMAVLVPASARAADARAPLPYPDATGGAVPIGATPSGAVLGRVGSSG